MTNSVMRGNRSTDAVMTGIEKGIAIAGQGTGSIQQGSMDIREESGILSDAVGYDVACTSSGMNRKGDGDFAGNPIAPFSIGYGRIVLN